MDVSSPSRRFGYGSIPNSWPTARNSPRVLVRSCFYGDDAADSTLAVGRCVNIPCTCVLKLMLRYSRYGSTMAIWLVLKRFLGFKFQVSLKVEGHRVPDPAFADLPATPNEFYSALKRSLKAKWLWNTKNENKQLWAQCSWKQMNVSFPMVQTPDRPPPQRFTSEQNS